MLQMDDESVILKRKSRHLEFAKDPRSQGGGSGLEKVILPYRALPDALLGEIDLSTNFLGKEINYPFFISCMTGGPTLASVINTRLAKAAQKYRIPMGLGSFRIALRHPEFVSSFQIRKYAPDIPLMANLGASTLNEGLTWQDCQKTVDLTGADALVFHLNPLQEALQEKGSCDFRGLASKIGKVVEKLSVPVIVKEVGHGIDYDSAKMLFESGVKIIDTAGTGGTSWAWIEAMVSGDTKSAEIFKNFGISTYDSINECLKISKLTVLGSGGVRTGIDVAKVLYMGCKLAGIAQPFLTAALDSEEAIEKYIESLVNELRIAKFCSQI